MKQPKFTPSELQWIKYLMENDEDANDFGFDEKRTKLNESIINKIKETQNAKN